MTIFRWGEFTSHAGLTLPFKIELDELTRDDWICLAAIVARQVIFGEVEGVPTGGLRFAEALYLHRWDRGGLLVVDDVLTTGASMERQRAGRQALGVVVFARTADVPSWITPMFQLDPKWM